ncbi:hypothetical protein L7F22_063361 [Adiantum nelumboides]|nr:hypothetical protein [Adiantum nelumboides]
MKLLCDVCENAVASVVCCADEAALCSSCDSRVHAANKLAGKHHRLPLVPETSEPVVCDICQERPSFFFCIEDRALLCRECDLSVHSANALAAKHRRFLLTGITVGMRLTNSTTQETSSTLTSLEKHVPATTTKDNLAFAMKTPVMQDTAVPFENCSRDDGSTGRNAHGNNLPPSPQKGSSNASLTPPPINAKSLRNYTMTKDGTLSMTSNVHTNSELRKATPTADVKLNSTTISIQRISAGQRVPFVAPVLSSVRSSLLREKALNSDHSKDVYNSNSGHGNNDNLSTNDSLMMDVNGSSPLGDDSTVSDYLNSGIPGWRLDEILTDLIGACDSGRSFSPPKESNVLGFGLQEEHSWFSELDFLEEHELSPSQEECVALVPEMPSPPTHSGLRASRGKPASPAAQPWAYDYLFTGPDDPNEFSVVPDVGIGGRRSLPDSPTSPSQGNLNKKRKLWLNFVNG